MTSTCVITGVAGFIGSHLAASMLADGWRIVGIDNFDPYYDRASKERNLREIAHDQLVVHELDILDRAPLIERIRAERPARIVHIAALAGVRPSIQSPERFVAVNLDGLTNVLDAAHAASCRSVLFASSSSVYGNSTVVPFREDDPVSAPISPYAATKRAGELLCHTYHHLFDMSIACLRFFTVFGPRQRPDLAIHKFMKLIAHGESVPMFGDGSTSRDYTYIDDIIAGIRAAGDWANPDTPRFGIFNLGGSTPVTLSDMIDRIARTVGSPAQIDQQPMQPGDVNQTYADLTHSSATLGYAPTMSFDEGLVRQWSWYQSVHA
ncbi:MAG: GDP-mannose 4,6-dehydratase [Planctomycetota bacterium]